MRIPIGSGATFETNARSVFNALWAEVDKLTGPKDLDLKGKRFANAGNALAGSDYVTRAQMRDYVRSKEFSDDAKTVIVERGGGSFGTHQLLSATHIDTNASGATRGDLIVANSAGLWSRFATGSSGQILLGGTDPSWGTSLPTLTFTTSEIVSGGNGSSVVYGYSTELITITGDNTDSSANMLPAGAFLLGVAFRVITTITRASSNPTQLRLGDTVTMPRFATGVAVTAGTSGVGGIHLAGSSVTDATGPTQATADKLRIFINGTGAVTAGSVRVIVYYIQAVPPTS